MLATATTVGLVELDFIPVPLAQVWRVVLWLGIVAVAARLLGDALGGGGLPSTRLGRWALLVLLAQNAVLMAERWNQPPALEYTPVTTIAVLIAWQATRFYDRPAEHYVRHRSGVPGGRLGQR